MYFIVDSLRKIYLGVRYSAFQEEEKKKKISTKSLYLIPFLQAMDILDLLLLDVIWSWRLRILLFTRQSTFFGRHRLASVRPLAHSCCNVLDEDSYWSNKCGLFKNTGMLHGSFYCTAHADLLKSRLPFETHFNEP